MTVSGCAACVFSTAADACVLSAGCGVVPDVGAPALPQAVSVKTSASRMGRILVCGEDLLCWEGLLCGDDLICVEDLRIMVCSL
jgi:hypothetical protein